MLAQAVLPNFSAGPTIFMSDTPSLTKPKAPSQNGGRPCARLSIEVGLPERKVSSWRAFVVGRGEGGVGVRVMMET